MSKFARRNWVHTTSLTVLAAAAIGVAGWGGGAAFAADLLARPTLPLPTLADPAAYSWTGLYVGAQIGYTSGRDRVEDVLTATNTFVGVTNQYRPSGVFGGLSAGADYQYGYLVGGVVGDLELSDQRGGFNDPPALPFNPGAIGRFSVRGQGSLRGRLGLAYDRFLVYGTGGFAFGELAYSYTNATTGDRENLSVYRSGWTAGVGVNYAVTDNIFVELEYRRSDYGTFDNVSTVAFPGLTGRERNYNDAGRLGIRYKF